MMLRNAWYVGAWADEIGDKPLARRICNEPVVLFRDKDGAPAALLDACCHRGAPLHMGKVVEQGSTAEILQKPHHAYTQALLAANPRYDRPDTGLEPTPPEVLIALRAEIAAFDATAEARDG